MTLWRQFAVVLTALGLLFGVACEKKKAQLPTKMQAPTLSVAVPEQIPETELPPEPPAQRQEATVEQPPPKKSPPKHRGSKKPVQPPANQANATTTTAVNRPPVNPAVEATTDTAIAADVTTQALNHQKQTTNELLDITEKDLKGLNRGLNHDEETMLTQIKSFIAQSRKATSDGDFERAYNLAMKAHLLADALVKK
jgi:hypothetical protein